MSSTRILGNAVMVIVFAVLCITGMEYLAINIGQPNPISHGYRVNAVFSDADGIPTAADVRVAGIVVGKVTDVNHDPQHPGATVVTMEISSDNADPVYTNGFAKVRPKTLLGEKYIDLTVGNSQGEAVPDGGMLPVARTSKDVSNDEIFNAFDAQTRKQQQQALQALDAATTERAGDIQDILPQLQLVLSNLDPVARVYEKDNPQVDSIFVNLNTVMQALADEHTQLASLLSAGNTALGAIAQRDNSLVATLQEASNVASEFQTAAAPTVDAQRQALSKLAGTLSDEYGFLDQILGPHCGGKPCGVDQVFNGTLLGQINYPSDQLTVTTPDGEKVTNEWDSMFSQPANGYNRATGQDNGSTHSALNISLSFHKDTVQATLCPIVQGGSDPVSQQLSAALVAAGICKAAP